jgi:Na+-driven multidrug efflux pump
MFLTNHLFGVLGIAWATPIAEVMSAVLSVVLFIPTFKMMKNLVNQMPDELR